MKENLEKSQKISISSPQFDVTPFLERTSERSEVIPGQSVSIRELLERAARGQRLGVQLHEPDMVSDQYPDGTPGVDENFDNMPPQGMDLAEFDEYARGVAAEREAFEAKRKKATEEAAPAEEDTTPSPSSED